MAHARETIQYEAWMTNVRIFREMLECVFRKMRMRYSIRLEEARLEACGSAEGLRVEVDAVELELPRLGYLRLYPAPKLSRVRVRVQVEGEVSLVRRFREAFNICTFRGGG